MELLTLDDYFQPVRMIENYESLIWSERYSVSGDFQLETADISTMINLLPTESYVTLRDSTVPMIVESHAIKKPLTDTPTLIVKGRAFETILERRSSVKELPAAPNVRPEWKINSNQPSDVAYKVIREVIGDPTARAGGTLPALAPAISPLDAFLRADNSPIVDLPLPADYSTGTTYSYEVPAGELYTTVLDFIAANHHGLKSVRSLTGDTKVALEIYNGADLTDTVVFDARFDQFDDATYLLSKQGSKNLAYIYGPNGSQSVRKNNAGPEVFGLDRRVLLIDETSDDDLNSPAVRTSRALVELYKYNSTALFDGETSVQVAAGFNNSYFLGDLITLNGEYGLSTVVRVAEFIRTADASGEKAYPTFEAVE